MPLAPGTRIGVYEITALIGAGGMGEVYRARDSKLSRDVALKVLPDLFADDAEMLARLQREAQVLASLNHPNIAQIYGLEEGGGVHALVLELVEGPTLDEIISPNSLSDASSATDSRGVSGPRMTIEDAIPIARQIANALEAAHDQGVVHRDLKPANVKVRPDGTVKVLDFGLAKALTPAASSPQFTSSSTLTSPAPTLGMILGTATYMAPEQTKGRAVDKRVDIWAFGAVLYEMLSGERAFKGDDVSDTLAAVLKADPDWRALPDLPPSIQRLLRRCLEKDPGRRLASISDARLELDDSVSGAAAAREAVRNRAPRGRLLAAAAAGAALSTVATLVIWPALDSAPVVRATRLSVAAPESQSFGLDGSESAISPNGGLLAFTTGTYPAPTRVWIRPIDSLVARPLEGGDGGRLPFWSPDSRRVGFFADGKLKTAGVEAGPVQVLCDAQDGRGATWSPAGIIVFAPTNAGPLLQVSANGGDSKPVTNLDPQIEEIGHRFPWFLPDGRHFLYAALPARSGKFGILVGSIDSTARRHILAADGAPVYAEPGYLLFSRAGELVAQRFDARQMQVSGEPVSLGDLTVAGVGYDGGRAVSASATGTIAYLAAPFGNTKLVWFDRTGRRMGPVVAPPGRYTEIAVAPNSRHAAVVKSTTPTTSEIWVIDLEGGGGTRMTSASAFNIEVVWAPDAKQFAFSSNRRGPWDLYVKQASGTEPERPVFQSSAPFKTPRSWSSDGQFVVFSQLDAQTGRDLWLLPLVGDRTPKPYLATQFVEDYGTISPDGRWMAYMSNESGRPEIYVRSFPEPVTKYRVTSGGSAASSIWAGQTVWWRRDGRELLMLDTDRRTLLSAAVQIGADFRVGTPRKLATLPKELVAGAATSGLERLLVSLPVDETAVPSITIVLDWTAALQRR